MKRPGCAVILGALALWSGGAAPTLGQETSSPDVIVDLNEAIYQYLWPRYLAAIEGFDSVLSREPGNTAALLFRALSHGQLGIVKRDEKQDWESAVLNTEELITVGQQSDYRARVESEIADLRRQLEDSAWEPWQRVSIDQQINERKEVLERIAKGGDKSLDQLRDDLRRHEAQFYDAAGQERQHYVAMIADLEALIKALRDPHDVIRLLEVVSRSKVARIDEDEAVRTVKADRSADVSELRDSAAETLEDLAGVLEQLLGRDLAEQDAVRVHFFLGVIRFRQAVPRRAEGEPATSIDESKLQAARTVMTELADNTQVEKKWPTFASLYLGLIIPFQARLEADDTKREVLYAEAERRLHEAARLDTQKDAEGAWVSVSHGDIPTLVSRQKAHIEVLRDQPAAVTEPINDFQLSVAIGAHRDTNVVLLGERTDLPRDISRERDFGFTLGTVLDYTVGLGKLDRRLDKWTLGVRGQVGQLWHCDVDEFDEQRYGGSAAIQYELWGKKEKFGPVYLRLQYDYDYTLLGRSAFLQTHGLSPNMQIFWLDRRAETDLYYRYEIRDYREPLFDRRFNRDGEYYALGLVQRYRAVDMTPVYERLGLEPWGLKGDPGLVQDDRHWPARWPEHWLEVFGGFEYSWDSTDGDEFDQKAYGFTTGLMMPLPYGLEFDAGAGFEWEEYAHGSRVDFHRRGRHDLIQRYEIGLSRTFVLRAGNPSNRFTPTVDRLVMTLRGHAAWTLDDSNVQDRLGQAIFSYDRAVYGVSVAFTLN